MPTKYVAIIFSCIFTLGLIISVRKLEKFEQFDSDDNIYILEVANEETRRGKCDHNDLFEEQSFCGVSVMHQQQNRQMNILLTPAGASFFNYHLTNVLHHQGHHINIQYFRHLSDPFEEQRILEIKASLPGVTVTETTSHCHLPPEEYMSNLSHIVFNCYDLFNVIKNNQLLVNRSIGCLTAILEQVRIFKHIHFTLLNTLPVGLPLSYFQRSDISLILQKSLEDIVKFYHINHGIAIAIVRLPYLFGPWSPDTYFVPKILNDFLQDRDYFNRMDSSCCSEAYILFAADAAKTVTKLISTPQTCQIVNLLSGQKYNYHHLIIGAFQKDMQNFNINLMSYFSSDSLPQEKTYMSFCVSSSNVLKQVVSSSKPVEEQMKEAIQWLKNTASVSVTKSSHDDVVLTSYFTSSVDPQRNKFVRPDNFAYMKTWFFSVEGLSLNGIVFYDLLSQRFIDKISSQHVTFVPTALQGRSTNDARFYTYFRYLKEKSHIKRVFLTDISDVEFVKNPFQLMDILGNHLYIGTDIDLFPTLASMGWLTKRLIDCFGTTGDIPKDIDFIKKLNVVYNAGVIGGTRQMVISFLEKVTDVLDKTPPGTNCNMPVVNYVVHKYFDRFVYTGYPLTSRFMKRQQNPTQIYIIHK